MITYAQFCPVAKAAEVFGDRWTPIILRELCFGTRAFGELLGAAPLISRTVLAQRLKQLAQAGVVHIEAKLKGKGHLYRLTPAGESFRPVIELMSLWGQRWGQGLIGPDDLDPKMLVWGMRRQIDPAQIPPRGFVIRFDFRGILKSNRSPPRLCSRASGFRLSPTRRSWRPSSISRRQRAFGAGVGGADQSGGRHRDRVCRARRRADPHLVAARGERPHGLGRQRALDHHLVRQPLMMHTRR